MKRLYLILLILIGLILNSCGSVSQPRYEIEDYIIIPTEIKNKIGSTNLNVFVFENDLTSRPIEFFLADKYNLENYQTFEFWSNYKQYKFYIKLLDKTETETYLDLSQLAFKNEVSNGSQVGNQSKFVAMSITNELGEDALNENSLFYSLAIEYLKSIKSDYLKKI